ncbi:hypothetical protein OG203_16945 [Nocardia sp. NBC_01499]|uniref:hypothetical protein n=1 Tax=Nocardia sp. NBC_01499 TaxID=2903597 RepID=UPI0038671E31
MTVHRCSDPPDSFSRKQFNHFDQRVGPNAAVLDAVAENLRQHDRSPSAHSDSEWDQSREVGQIHTLRRGSFLGRSAVLVAQALSRDPGKAWLGFSGGVTEDGSYQPLVGNGRRSGLRGRSWVARFVMFGFDGV